MGYSLGRYLDRVREYICILLGICVEDRISYGCLLCSGLVLCIFFDLVFF